MMNHFLGILFWTIFSKNANFQVGRWGLTSESGGTVLLDKPKYVTQCSSRTFQAENIVCFLLYPTLLLPFYEGKNSKNLKLR